MNDNNNHTPASIVSKIWSFCHILRDDGVSYGDYLEQLTYLLFLKMADEYSKPPYNREIGIPEEYSWGKLAEKRGAELEQHYNTILRELAKRKGILGQIFVKSQNKIQDPAKLYRLIDMIDREQWSIMGTDLKGQIYEGLLEKLDREEKHFLKYNTFFGNEIVANTRRLALMNLFLHNIGDLDADSLISPADSLVSDTGLRVDYVLTNPPFGKKSSMTFVNEEGDLEKEELTYNRQDFWASTSNKQLNFVQHIRTLLKIDGKAAVVVPDNVLFEGGAGETVRQKLLQTTDLHTILRLPTGIFYRPGVKANVIFFDNKPASKEPWTKEIWIYDFRTNVHFTLKKKPLTFQDLSDFITCFHPENRHERSETWHPETNPDGRWRRFTYEEIVTRDKTSLDIIWIKDKSLVDLDNLPEPDEIASEIVENVEAALESFREVMNGLE